MRNALVVVHLLCTTKSELLNNEFGKANLYIEN